MSDIIGYVIGEATTTRTLFISKTIPKVGEYVILRYDGKVVLGMVENLVRGSISLGDEISDSRIVEKISKLEGVKDHYIKGSIRILGDVNQLKIPRTPPPPATVVERADEEILRRIFNPTGVGIRIGVLISNPRVPVYLDINKMVTRHLAILAITGAGKSNTVAVIADGITKLGGAVLIFDMHSEYVDADFTGGVNLILPRINPLNLHVTEFMKLMRIGGEAYKQEYYLRKAYSKVKSTILKNPSLSTKILEMLESELRSFLDIEDYKRDRHSILSIINKLDSLREHYGEILDPLAPSIIYQLKLNRVNVLDLGSLDEEAADVIVSHYLRATLFGRKKYKTGGRGLSFPVFIVLEEAHILAPRDRETLSKYWISRIAREGRKFGLGLCLVSQRPKALDSDTLSQANNLIVLRLVEPSDQRYVQQASETLSEDLVEQLPALNIGEAVVLGLMVKVPAIVKIDLFEGKLSGGDIDVVSEWHKAMNRQEVLREEYEEIVEEW
ncbi:MAG: ATPase [Thermoprotei archaeon]|nr:MAG: ATPase [Thermoprotei archaeon]